MFWASTPFFLSPAKQHPCFSNIYLMAYPKGKRPYRFGAHPEPTAIAVFTRRKPRQIGIRSLLSQETS